MPRCTSCRWGTGTTSEKPTIGSKEMEEKYARLQAERLKQDNLSFGGNQNNHTNQNGLKNIQGLASNTTGQIHGRS
jgi:hypothetical protein